MIDAKTALEWGLINQVVAPAVLMPEPANWPRRSSPSRDHRAPGQGGDAGGVTMTEDAGLAYEHSAFGISFGSADRVEGTKAFVEKRDPKWQGK